MMEYQRWKNSLRGIQKRVRADEMKTTSEIIENARDLLLQFQEKYLQAPIQFGDFCENHGGNDFSNTTWKYVKTLLDKIYFTEQGVQTQTHYPTEIEKALFEYMKIDDGVRSVVLKCLLEFGQYGKFMQFDLNNSIIEPKNAYKLSGETDLENDSERQHTYLTHAIIASRRYGIPSIPLIEKCINMFPKQQPLHFITCLDALYGDQRTLDIILKVRLEWLMVLRCYFPPVAFPEIVKINEREQTIVMNYIQNVTVHIPDLEEFIYVVTHFFEPEPLRDGLMDALHTGQDSLYL